jgi:hypothetical protein
MRIRGVLAWQSGRTISHRVRDSDRRVGIGLIVLAGVGIVIALMQTSCVHVALAQGARCRE